MQIDSSSQDRVEAYGLLYNRSRFGFASKLNLQNLKYFSDENQQKLGKIDVRLNINALRRLRNNQNFNYLIMTDYQQIVPLIYFIRSQPSGCRVLTTKIMMQCAKIFAEDIYQMIKKKNQVVSTPSYEEESEAYDAYELHFQIDFSSWVPLFKKQQIDSFISKCIAVNYGQVYDTDRGTLITSYPSGINVGSAVWLFQNPQTKNKLLWVQGLSHHSWRACQEFRIDPIHSEIQNVVFTVGVLSEKSTDISDEHECLEFFKTISKRVNKAFNSRMVLEDFMVIPDIINNIYIEFKDNLKRMILTGVSMNKIMSYVNSYPEFLTNNHKRRIYEDPPTYPFDTYEQMKDKIIVEGTIEQISTEKKMPSKEFELRSTPYIHFEADYHAYLFRGDGEVVQPIFQKSYSMKKLRNFLSECTIGKITCICKSPEDIKTIPDFGQPFSLCLLQQNIFIPDTSIWKYYQMQGQKPNLICSYQKKNNILILKPIDKKFRQIKSNWPRKLEEEMRRFNVKCVKIADHFWESQLSKVYVDDYVIKVESSNLEQLQIINWVISQNSRIFKLA